MIHTDDQLLAAFANAETRLQREIAVQQLVAHLLTLAEQLDGHHVPPETVQAAISLMPTHMQQHAQESLASMMPQAQVAPDTNVQVLHMAEPTPHQHQNAGARILEMVGPLFPQIYILRPVFDKLSISGVVTVCIIMGIVANIQMGRNVGHYVPFLQPIMDSLVLSTCVQQPTTSTKDVPNGTETKK